MVYSMQLHVALLECIQITLAAGSIEALAELFEEKAADISLQLKKLVGQVS
jgi:hypothetical protein